MAPPDTKRIGSLSVLFVMATQQEHGPHLQKRVKPVITGVGPVEAGIATAAALAELTVHHARPNLVFSLGSAGSRDLEHAGVYQVASITYRDMDCSALGFERGVTPFLDQPRVVTIPHRIDGIPAATLSSGAKIISGSDYDALGAEMADMESYSVFRAAARFGVPMIGLRGISDGRTELTGLHDWTEYLHVIDEKLAAALDLFRSEVENGAFSLAEPAVTNGQATGRR
jgi:adenosylhomocysteine nucleosidase